MYAELYQYLIHYKKLPVPGIGTFLLDKKPASVDFPNRLLYPPVYEVGLQSIVQPPSRNFFSWLGTVLQVPERTAVIRFNDFVYELRQQVSAGNSIHWVGVGNISKGFAGEVKFIPDSIVSEQPVKAEKVIREKAEHMVRVGEDERTSVEMEAMLSKTVEKRSYWWVTAAVIALLAIMFIGWYFSEYGVSVMSTANTKKIIPAEAGTTTRSLP